MRSASMHIEPSSSPTASVGGERGWSDRDPAGSSRSLSRAASPGAARGLHSPASFDPDAHAASEATFWAEAGASTVALTPSAMKQEREDERNRRRAALRKKADLKRGINSSAQSSPQASAASTPHSQFPSVPSAVPAGFSPMQPNDGFGLHPSLQHQLQFARTPSARSSAAYSTPRSVSSPAVSSSSRRAPPPMHDDDDTRIDIRDGGGDGDEDDPLTRILGHPDDDLSVLERAHSSFWTGLSKWDQEQRVRGLQAVAWAQGVLGVAFMLAAVATLGTAFANPAVHWTAIVLGVISLMLAWCLRSAAFSLRPSSLLNWLIASSVQVGLLLVLGILSFHGDAFHMDRNLREEWNGMGMVSRVELFENRFGLLQNLAERNLITLGAAALAHSLTQVVCMCIVLAIRTHILTEQSTEQSTQARSAQFNQRLHNRQRMARLSAAVKERRRQRKQRGRTSSGAMGSNGAFTGVGSVAAAAARGDSTPGGSAIPMSTLSAAASPTASAPQSSLPSASGPPLSGSPSVADLDRYAGMLSEEVEDALEQEEQSRETAAALGKQ